MINVKSLLSKKGLIIAVPIAVVIILYFTLFIQWPTSTQVSGTIGGIDNGVQRAIKFRSEQITQADVILKNPEFQNIIQSDAFQKLLKNENFIKWAADGNLSAIAQNNFLKLSGNTNFIFLIGNQAFSQAINNKIFNALSGLSMFDQVIFNQSVISNLSKGAISKVEASAVFQNMINSQGFQQTGLTPNQVLSLFQTESFKTVVTSNQFQAFANNQSLISFMSNPNNINLLPKAEVLSQINSSGFSQLATQQSFSNFIITQQFQFLAKENGLQTLSRSDANRNDVQ
jgi:hypothetical protein